MSPIALIGEDHTKNEFITSLMNLSFRTSHVAHNFSEGIPSGFMMEYRSSLNTKVSVLAYGIENVYLLKMSSILASALNVFPLEWKDPGYAQWAFGILHNYIPTYANTPDPSLLEILQSTALQIKHNSTSSNKLAVEFYDFIEKEALLRQNPPFIALGTNCPEWAQLHQLWVEWLNRDDNLEFFAFHCFEFARLFAKNMGFFKSSAIFDFSMPTLISRGISVISIFRQLDSYSKTLISLRDHHFCEQLVSARQALGGPIIVRMGADHISGVQQCLKEMARNGHFTPPHTAPNSSLEIPLYIINIKKGFLEKHNLTL